MKQARRFLIVASTLIVALLALECVVGIVAAEMALHPGRKVETPQSQQLAQTIASRHNARLEEVSITASDGIALRAWSIHPAQWNGDAAILLHGHTDNRAGMLGNADLLLGRGYAVLLPDARAHGLSGGDLATYGVKEADDLKRWFDWLKQAEAPACIDGLGESMGAAQLLQALRTTPAVCAVVAESPFASFRQASYDRMGQQLHLGAGIGRTLLRPAVDAGFLYVRWKYGVDLENASPENAVAESEVPVLLIHGKRDTNLPPRHSEAILAASLAHRTSVVLWEPPNAGHCGAAGAEPEEYERRVVTWFSEHNRSNPRN
jgi:dipeptidyl aminopeptidase/acylaminoacyl peptidase